jgi:hypothetical protein
MKIYNQYFSPNPPLIGGIGTAVIRQFYFFYVITTPPYTPATSPPHSDDEAIAEAQKQTYGQASWIVVKKEGATHPHDLKTTPDHKRSVHNVKARPHSNVQPRPLVAAS